MKLGLYEEPLCTLVTQLLNPVRPKWLRPSRHLNLAAPHADCLRGRCARHMVVVSLSPHIHMCGNLCKAVGARQRRPWRRPPDPQQPLHMGSFYPAWYPHSSFFPPFFFVACKVHKRPEFQGRLCVFLRPLLRRSWLEVLCFLPSVHLSRPCEHDLPEAIKGHFLRLAHMFTPSQTD